MRKRRWPDLLWWRHATFYGVLLALAAALLQWLDYRWLARTLSFEFYLLMVAAGFLALGLYIGAHVIGRQPPLRAPGNPDARKSLGVSEREMAVLLELAAGYSNKEIARRLDVSPNTVKTHVARLFEKLGARRRTDAIARAREIGLLS